MYNYDYNQFSLPRFVYNAFFLIYYVPIQLKLMLPVIRSVGLNLENELIIAVIRLDIYTKYLQLIACDIRKS